MDETPPEDSPLPTSRVASPPYLRSCPVHRLVVWQPRGILDDKTLDEMLGWLAEFEKTSPPFNRFIDFTQVTKMALQIGHLFTAAAQRASKYRDIASIKTAFFCDTLAGFGTAHLYETLLKDTSIEARAFQNRAEAAAWLGVPEEILQSEEKNGPTE